MLFHHHTIKRRTQLKAVQRTARGHTSANGSQFLLGVGSSNFGFTQRLLGLQIVLLGRYFFLPQLFFTLVGGACQTQSFLRSHQLAALLRNCRAGQDGQQLPLFHYLPQIGGHALGHTRHARHDVGCLVFVEANFTG